jgi:hypothetical protein
MTGCVISPPPSIVEKSWGKDDKEEIPIPAFPDISTLDLRDDKTAPVFGSNRVKHPPPLLPVVAVDEGFVVVTPTMYLIFFFSSNS